MSTDHRSLSQYQSLAQCGHRYWLERVVKVPQTPSLPAHAGKVIHAAAEATALAIWEESRG